MAYGDPTDLPIVGDWDGNGTFTPGVVRGQTWLLRNSNSRGEGTVTFVYGAAGDKPIAGDWNGDGAWTPGVIRGNTWMLRDSNSGGPTDGQFSWARNTDVQLYSGVAASAS